VTRLLAALALLAAAAPAEEPAAYREEACRQCHEGPGTRRAGPLPEAFLPRSREWHLAHLFDARAVSAESTMPSWASRFRRSPREGAVREFVLRHDSRDGSLHEDGIVTRAEYEATGGADWGAALRDLDTGNEVISLADAAPEPDPDLLALATWLEGRGDRAAPAPPPDPPSPGPGDPKAGRALFLRHCAGCHGERGDGNGPAAPFFGDHPPRNFLRGEYKFRSTLAPDPPTDADLARTIRRGAGGGMPAFPHLSGAQVGDLVELLKGLHPDYREPEPIVLPQEGPPWSEESAAIGARLYRELECGKCHGEEGRGDGTAAAETRGSLGQIVRPFDLTRGPFKGGSDPESLVRTLMTGLQGTPMPSYASSLPRDSAFHLAHFVESVVVTTGSGDGSRSGDGG
jgi:mono/diheme cytochrome c family protein